jgi:RNA polymerase sigma-70 factor (ECF subfamily)
MADGDTEGFDQFYGRVFGPLVGQLLLVTGDQHEAEDVVQEALTRAAVRWRRISRYEVPDLWVRRVALNLAANGARRRRRRLAALVRIGPPPELPPASPDAVALAQALRTLPMPYRQALVLHHLIGLPVTEVATELGVPEGTVKTRLARGRRRLAEALGDASEKGHQHA